MHPLSLFGIGIVGFLILTFLGIPVAFSFAIVGLVGVMLLRSPETGLFLIGSAPYVQISLESLIAIPLFVLMGQFVYHSDISADLFDAGRKWVGRLPGGLAMASNLAATAFAACTGSAIASGATMSTVAYPEMKRLNYDDRLATGAVAAGGTLAILIPPSITFIVYGYITQIDIGQLFIAGILPGLLLSGLNLSLIMVWCKRNPKLGPPTGASTWPERFKSLKGVWGMLVLLLVVLGSLYFGVVTPTEAGAIGSFGAFIVTIAKRRLTLRILLTTLEESLVIACQVLTMIVGSMIFGAFVAASGFTLWFQNWLLGLTVAPVVVVIIILLAYIPLGMFIDAIPMVLLTVPIVFPVLQGMGVNLVWFGVLTVVLAQIAFISPPVGLVAYVTQGVTKVPLQTIFRGCTPFIIVMLTCVAILVAFPEISLFLPGLM